MSTSEASKKDRSIRFTIDGRPFSVAEPAQTAASLLRLAGLDPAGYDLGQLHGNDPRPKLYDDSDKVHVNDGERFVTVRQSAAVA